MAKEKLQGTCFVVMGFGKKTDFETGRVLDLDKSYKYIIKPAVEATGLKCIRADEIVHSGLIDAPMYDQLLKADVVIADLSTSNKNAYYELGVRHALRPFTTVIICEDGIKTFPFDINHVAVRQYHHLGDDIGFDEVNRFRKQLTSAIKQIYAEPRTKDSPVYTLLGDLTPPELTAVRAKVNEAVAISFNNIEASIPNKSITATPPTIETHSALMEQIDKAQADGDWLTAKNLLTSIRQMRLEELKKQQIGDNKKIELQEDTYTLQRLALATYKSKKPDEISGLGEAKELLETLSPATSNDSETLGLWGAVHKRLHEITKESAYLDEAIRAYERGFYIKNDYYNGINFAYLLNVRAAQQNDHAEAITDFVEAQRVRKEVLEICKKWLSDNPMPKDSQLPEGALNDYLESWYWVKATIGEAYAGLGKAEAADVELNSAYAKAPKTWMKGTTTDQVGKLKLLIADSPLRFIKGE